MSDTVGKDEFKTSIGRLDDTLRASKLIAEQNAANQNDAVRQELQPMANGNGEEQKLAMRNATTEALANQNEQGDGVDVEHVNDPSTTERRAQRQSERRAMSECGDEREAVRKSRMSDSEKPARAFWAYEHRKHLRPGKMSGPGCSD
jgi:hypothetical protein